MSFYPHPDTWDEETVSKSIDHLKTRLQPLSSDKQVTKWLGQAEKWKDEWKKNAVKYYCDAKGENPEHWSKYEVILAPARSTHYECWISMVEKQVPDVESRQAPGSEREKKSKEQSGGNWSDPEEGTKWLGERAQPSAWNIGSDLRLT